MLIVIVFIVLFYSVTVLKAVFLFTGILANPGVMERAGKVVLLF